AAGTARGRAGPGSHTTGARPRAPRNGYAAQSAHPWAANYKGPRSAARFHSPRPEHQPGHAVDPRRAIRPEYVQSFCFISSGTQYPGFEFYRQRPRRLPRTPATCTKLCAVWAWQSAMARASAASAWGLAVSFNRFITICCTWVLSASPRPTTDCLTLRAAYSDTGNPFSTAARIATPLACPNFNTESAFFAMKTCSMAACSG